MSEDSIDTIRERLLEEGYTFTGYDPEVLNVLNDARAIVLAFDALTKKLKSHPPDIHQPVKIPGPREWIKWDQFNPRERLVLRQQDSESEMCDLSFEIATSTKETAQTEKAFANLSLTSEEMMWLWGAVGELLLGGDAPDVKLAKTILENDDRADLIQQMRVDFSSAASHVDFHIRDLTIVLEALDNAAVDSAKLLLRHSIDRAKEFRGQLDTCAARTTNSTP